MPAPKAWLGGEKWDGVPRALWAPWVEVTVNAKALYAFFCSKVDGKLVGMPTEEECMAALQVRSDNTIRKTLRELLDANMLVLIRKRERGQHGRWEPAVYRLMPPGEWFFQPPSEIAGGRETLSTAKPPSKSAGGPPSETADGPPSESAAGPPSETAEGDGSGSRRPPAESAGDVLEREKPEMRAHTRGAKPRPDVPDLPSIDWDGDLEQLGAALWEIAAGSAGRVRIRVPGEIFDIADVAALEFSVDVLTAGPDADSGRTVVLWSGTANLEEGIQRGLKVSAYLKHWLTVVQKFRTAIAFRDGDWSQGQWTRYPGPNVCFREVAGRGETRGSISRGLLIGIALAAATFAAGFGAGVRSAFNNPPDVILPPIEVRAAIPGAPTADSWELAYFDLARQCEVFTVGDSIGRQLPARAP